VIAAGARPDYVADAKTVDRRPRNLVLGIVVLICVALVVLQPQLILWLVVTFGSTLRVSLSRSLRWHRWRCRWRWQTQPQ
jgi:hypothetical protein